MDWLKLKIFILFLISRFSDVNSKELGASCSIDKECTVKNSFCMSGICTCKHYFAAFNSTKCLNSKLLDYECLVDKQCSLRVANSICRNGLCQCSEGFIRFRKHTCLNPAKPGDICYSDEHCKMYNLNSFCQYVIPDLFGKCKCKSDASCHIEEFSELTRVNESTQEINNLESFTEDFKKPDTELLENSWNQNNAAEKEILFADPFSYQKEYLEDSISTSVKKTNDSELEKWNEYNFENKSNEMKIENSTNVENEFENSVNYTKENEENEELSAEFSSDNEFKYRVETNQKNLDYKTVWDNTTPVSLGYPCYSDIQCLKRDSQSKCVNGVCDCINKSNDTNFCGQHNTGCHKETFQCRSSGTCISWFFVCNGKKDCEDGSDEECDGPTCPNSSFQCNVNGKCVSLGVLCDGIINCPNAEDEHFCLPQNRNVTEGCPENTFQCANSECVPQYEFCNAIPKCSDSSDEFSHICKPKMFNNISVTSTGRNYCPFECGNRKCRSTAIVCSGRNGCGDNSDENHCSVCRCAKT